MCPTERDKAFYKVRIENNKIISKELSDAKSVTVHTRGRNEEHGDEDKLKITVFNVSKQGKARQGKARQGKADTDRTSGSNE